MIAAETGRIHGFRYPSRKHRGHDAIALSSRSVEALAPHLTISHQRFGETAACAALAGDACCTPAPPG